MCQQPSPEQGVSRGVQGSPGLSSVPGTGSRVNYVLGVKKTNITHKNQLLSLASPIPDRSFCSTSSLLLQAATKQQRAWENGD